MKLIVECGATKSDWTLLDGSEIRTYFKTEGLNFSSGDDEFIARTLEEALLKIQDALDCEVLDEVYFYAAGLFPSEDSDSSFQHLYRTIRSYFKEPDIYLESDLLAAARAVCGHEYGIACIIGTGSNVCVYDGNQIVKKISSGGFILGDEGSASALGRAFISDYIKGLVPECVALAFAEKYDLAYPSIVQNVYHSASPAAYLGRFAPDILSFYEINRYMQHLVDENFRRFIDRCIRPCMDNDSTVQVGVVGSFGYACKEILAALSSREGVQFSKFIKSPSEDLIRYHAG